MAMESPTNDFGKGAKGAKAAAGIAQKTRQFIQVAKVLVKGGAGPAGWAMAAAQILAPLIKKIKKAAAIVGAIIALRVFMHIMQLAGLVAGLAFGAISGLPLLLIPVAGPFLYTGWVAFWGYRGFTNPFDTIQLATHPWEIITRPLNWLGQRFSDLGSYFKGGTEYVGSGVGNAASTAFYGAANFATGLASSLWGGVTSAVGNAAGWLSGVASNALGLASTVTSSAASIVSVGVGGTVAAVGIGSLLVSSNYIVALSTTEGDLAEEINYPGVNELFTITKTVDNSQIATPPVLTPTPVTFTVTITAAGNNLTNLQFSDTTSASNGEPISTGANTCQQINLPPTLTAGAPWTCTLVVNANVSHDSATITNTASFTASTENAAKTETDTASATVRVGDVPAGCPEGWPTTGIITQGPDGAASHAAGSLSLGDPGYEAIDIGKGGVFGDPIYATFAGTVINIWHKAGNEAYDKRVEIAPLNCPRLNFVAFWHNQTINVNIGDVVNYGQVIARSGAYKASDGSLVPHLHYQFNASGDRSFPIEAPYIPDDSYGRTCSNDTGCGVTITSAP